MQVTEAVASVHCCGVIHGDLTPANVLIGETGKAWLTDFGFARDMQLTTEAVLEQEYIAGTAPYLAPEQFDFAGRISPATDIHGLGAILYASLTGRAPYANRIMGMIEPGQSTTAIDYRLLEAQPTALVTICRRCLEIRPSDRFPNAQAVLQALREANELI
jgi:eukaryotic-like serine/threonine-protein kinase